MSKLIHSLPRLLPQKVPTSAPHQALRCSHISPFFTKCLMKSLFLSCSICAILRIHCREPIIACCCYYVVTCWCVRGDTLMTCCNEDTLIYAVEINTRVVNSWVHEADVTSVWRTKQCGEQNRTITQYSRVIPATSYKQQTNIHIILLHW